MKPKQSKDKFRSDRFLGHGSETTFATPGAEGSWLDVFLMSDNEDDFTKALQKIQPFITAKTARLKEAAKLKTTNTLVLSLQVADKKVVSLLGKAVRSLGDVKVAK